MVFDALSIQSIIESPVLQSQRSTLLGPLMFVPDRTPGVTPRFLCYANYRDAGTCLLAFEGFQAWLLTRDWCHEVTAYIKQSGPPAQRVMIPADQTLVVKGVPEDKKELIVLALQKQTAGIMGRACSCCKRSTSGDLAPVPHPTTSQALSSFIG